MSRQAGVAMPEVMMNDFTERLCRCGHPLHYYKCRLGECDCPAQADKSIAADVTPANSFTEQARQLDVILRTWIPARLQEQVRRLINSFASEAEQRGQAAIVQEIVHCEKCDLCEDHLP